MPGRIKELMVKEYVEQLKSIKNMFAVTYTGLQVEATNDLRSKLFAGGNRVLHVRNRIFRKALEGVDLNGISPFIEGPSAIVYGEDLIAAIKTVMEFAKENKGVEISGGYFEGRIMSPGDVDALSKIPPREVLLCQVMGAMKAPVAGVASLLTGLMQKMVLTLKEIEKQKA